MTTNIYGTVGTTKKWKSSGGDGVFTLTSKVNASGRIGDRVDLGNLLVAGPAARAMLFRYYGTAKAQATSLVVGNTIDMFLACWNDDVTPGNPDGGNSNVGSSDANYNTQNQLRNLLRLKSIIVDDAAGSTVMSRSGLVLLPYRYVSPVWWNATGATLSATATDFEFWLTPVNWQSQ